MTYNVRKPRRGDIIRVKVTFYHHYGIYVDDRRIIQFGMPDNVNREASEVRVCVSDIDEFLSGGELEVMELSFKEKHSMRSADDVVRIAESRVGEGGYNVFTNNCEHFVMSCKFKEK